MNASKPNYTPALVVLTSLFFTWGLITSLNDILVPHFKAIFTLNYVQAMLVQLCFFSAYFFASIPSGLVVQRIGYRNGIIAGLSVAGLGCLGFYPAAVGTSYALFLLSLFVLACGITLLQVAANPAVAGLGDSETAASRLNLTQAFNSLGTTIGPALGSALILGGAAIHGGGTTHEIQTVKAPYLVLAALLFLTAFVFSRFHLPVLASESEEQSAAHGGEVHGSLAKQPHLMLGVGAIFLYVGAEVSIGSFLVNFLALPEIASLPEQTAGHYLSLYWGGAMVGRFIGSAALRKLPAGRVLAFNASIVILLIITAIAVRGHVAMWTVLAVGLFNSIMFPTIFTLAIERLGHRTSTASGWLCTAIVGGALVPVLMGFFADRIGLALAFVVPAVCYAYIVHYGLIGHVVRERA
ncbi:MAG TPA: sugar MFS transporter [Polyangiales bacterium]|nr:sugar MFS transporter [Polyangiales bacterium]